MIFHYLTYLFFYITNLGFPRLKGYHTDVNIRLDFPIENPMKSTVFLHFQMHATFKVIVLRRQQELVGPPQHSIIRIT